MSDGEAFADVLRAKLDYGKQTATSATSTAPDGRRFATPPFFTAEGPWARPRPPAWAFPPAPAPPRHVTVLSAEARRALADLNALGADLDDRVSPVELRRAFRQLARHYHPDRHPHGSQADRERLARSFIAVTGLYRRLAAALETATWH